MAHTAGIYSVIYTMCSVAMSFSAKGIGELKNSFQICNDVAWINAASKRQRYEGGFGGEKGEGKMGRDGRRGENTQTKI